MIILDRHPARIVTLGITVALFAASFFATACSKKAVVTRADDGAVVRCSASRSRPPRSDRKAAPVLRADHGRARAPTRSWTATSSAYVHHLHVTGSGTGKRHGRRSPWRVNTGAERTSTLTIAGATIAITQRAAVATPPATPAALRATAIAEQAVRTSSCARRSWSTMPRPLETIGTVTHRSKYPATARSRTIRRRPSPGRRRARQRHDQLADSARPDAGRRVFLARCARPTRTITTALLRGRVVQGRRRPLLDLLSTTSVSASASGGSTTITITTSSVCSWVSISNDIHRADRARRVDSATAR